MTFKKFLRYTTLGVLLAFPACGGGSSGCSFGGRTCTSTLPVGTEGGCCSTGRTCDAGLVCNAYRTCEACGGDGDRCCDGAACGSGLTCEDAIGRCGDCGEAGERCCAEGFIHSCRGDAVCNIYNDMCEGMTHSACAGPVGVRVNCDAGHGCTTALMVFPNVGETTEECASMFGCSIVDDAEDFHFCADSPLEDDITLTEFSTSLANARSCAEFRYGDYENFRDGCCPRHASMCPDP
jgi:hypothetical protein